MHVSVKKNNNQSAPLLFFLLSSCLTFSRTFAKTNIEETLLFSPMPDQILSPCDKCKRVAYIAGTFCKACSKSGHAVDLMSWREFESRMRQRIKILLDVAMYIPRFARIHNEEYSFHILQNVYQSCIATFQFIYVSMYHHTRTQTNFDATIRLSRTIMGKCTELGNSCTKLGYDEYARMFEDMVAAGEAPLTPYVKSDFTDMHRSVALTLLLSRNVNDLGKSLMLNREFRERLREIDPRIFSWLLRCKALTIPSDTFHECVFPNQTKDPEQVKEEEAKQEETEDMKEDSREQDTDLAEEWQKEFTALLDPETTSSSATTTPQTFCKVM